MTKTIIFCALSAILALSACATPQNTGVDAQGANETLHDVNRTLYNIRSLQYNIQSF